MVAGLFEAEVGEVDELLFSDEIWMVLRHEIWARSGSQPENVVLKLYRHLTRGPTAQPPATLDDRHGFV